MNRLKQFYFYHTTIVLDINKKKSEHMTTNNEGYSHSTKKWKKMSIPFYEVKR